MPMMHSKLNREREREAERCTHLLKLNRSLSKTRTGPVLLRMVRGWPASKQKITPVTAVPRKLSNTPWTHTQNTHTEHTHRTHTHTTHTHKPTHAHTTHAHNTQREGRSAIVQDQVQVGLYVWSSRIV